YYFISEQTQHSEFKGIRGLREILTIKVPAFLPEYRCAPIGGYHGKYRILEHIQPVRDTKGKGAPAAAFADHHRDQRDPQPRHLHQVYCDRFRLTAFLRPYSRIRAWRIDKGDDRPLEFFREFHQPQRLSVSLRIGLAEIASYSLLCPAALLMAHKHHRGILYFRKPAHDRFIVCEPPVAVKFDKVLRDKVNI